MNKTLLIIALFVSVFLLVVYILKQRSNNNLPNKRYTIASITQIEEQKNGALYHYTFQVATKIYKGTFRHNSKKIKPGTRYYIAYNGIDPSQNFVEIQHPVPGTMTEVPQEGWDQLP